MIRTATTSMAALVFLVSCAAVPSDSATVTGTVTYRERIALLPGSQVYVALEATGGDASTVLADTTFSPEGQPPFPFTLTYDPSAIDSTRTYVVRAEIRGAEDGPLWTTTEPRAVLTQGHPSDVEVVVHRSGAEPDSEVTEAVSEIWADARQRGVDFRAAGNEPGWYLEIHKSDSLTLVADYGQREVTLPTPAPEVENGTITYHAETQAHDLTVTIEAVRCTDSMSGAVFESTVTVRLDDATYNGCGRALTALTLN